MTDKRSSPVKAIIGADKVVGLQTEDGLDVPGFDGTGYVTDEELEEALDSLPIQKGAGHDSAVLKATPNPEDPSVDRTNTVTGAFSAILAGSRNNISATESAAVGGIISIIGGGNNFGAGYRQTLNDCENSMSNGYRNTLNNCAQVKALGRSLNLTFCNNGIFAGYDITCTGTSNAKCEGNALFGRDIHSTVSYGLSAGMHHTISNSCAAVIGEYLITSKYGQTNVGMWNKANDRAYFVVGSGFGEGTRKNCFAAGWYSDGATEEDRRVIWIGDTMFSEKQLKELLVGSNGIDDAKSLKYTQIPFEIEDQAREPVVNPEVAGVKFVKIASDDKFQLHACAAKFNRFTLNLGGLTKVRQRIDDFKFGTATSDDDGPVYYASIVQGLIRNDLANIPTNGHSIIIAPRVFIEDGDTGNIYFGASINRKDPFITGAPIDPLGGTITPDNPDSYYNTYLQISTQSASEPDFTKENCPIKLGLDVEYTFNYPQNKVSITIDVLVTNTYTGEELRRRFCTNYDVTNTSNPDFVNGADYTWQPIITASGRGLGNKIPDSWIDNKKYLLTFNNFNSKDDAMA